VELEKLQAENSVIGNISRHMEKALANGWEITPFKRNYKMPQSAISHQPSANYYSTLF